MDAWLTQAGEEPKPETRGRGRPTLNRVEGMRNWGLRCSGRKGSLRVQRAPWLVRAGSRREDASALVPVACLRLNRGGRTDPE